jgi:CDP-diglyceride synthetase
MNFYKKTMMAFQLLLIFFIPIYYNIFLLRIYSSLVCILSCYEFYNKILKNNIISNYFHIFFYYWLLFPIIIINFLIPLQECWNAIMITVFSDGIQQFSNRIFVKIYNQDNNIKKIMLYNPFRIISPNKTVVGYLGGLLTLLLYPFFNYNINFILLLYIFGCIGDLFASYFKRIVKINDYSNCLGSHGGFLDRFDAIILNMHFIYVFSLLSIS